MYIVCPCIVYLEGVRSSDGDDNALPGVVHRNAVGRFVEAVLEVCQHQLRAVRQLGPQRRLTLVLP